MQINNTTDDFKWHSLMMCCVLRTGLGSACMGDKLQHSPWFQGAQRQVNLDNIGQENNYSSNILFSRCACSVLFTEITPWRARLLNWKFSKYLVFQMYYFNQVVDLESNFIDIFWNFYLIFLFVLGKLLEKYCHVHQEKKAWSKICPWSLTQLYPKGRAAWV